MNIQNTTATRVIFSTDNYIFPSEEMKEIVRDNFKANGLEVPEDDSDEFYQELQEIRFSDEECFFEDLGHDDDMCIITGSVGVWTGQHKVVPHVVRGLKAALLKCIRECDYYTFKLSEDSKTISVESSHHDGTNYLDVRIFTPEAYERYEELSEDDNEDEFNLNDMSQFQKMYE